MRSASAPLSSSLRHTGREPCAGISSIVLPAQQPAEHLAGLAARELGPKFDGAILAQRGRLIRWPAPLPEVKHRQRRARRAPPRPQTHPSSPPDFPRPRPPPPPHPPPLA